MIPRSAIRFFKNVRTIAGSVIVMGSLIAGLYALWPFPKQVQADIDGLKARDVQHNGQLDDLETHMSEFVMEQRVAVGKQEEAAELTKEVMLRLLDRIEGE